MTAAKQLVGKYEIERKIGEGGFGIVYQATDTTLERTVALKQLKLELSASPEYLSRFKRESRLMGSLNHPNIVRILEVFEDNGRYFIVMDYMPNGSLAEKLKDGKPVALDRAIEILKPIARAVDYAHGKNLVHRDIKPSNILFNEDDEPVLSDFGLVKSLETRGSTTTGVAFGTPEYMAPEQILCKELSPAADVYSLGVVAYQMLSGEVPFPGDTPFEIQEGHVHREPVDITAVNEALPENLSAIFAKALAKDPAERYASARTFVEDIEKENLQKVTVSKTAKLATVKDYLDEKDFASAAVMLQEMLAVQPDSGLFEMLTECQRREEIWGQYQKMKKDLAAFEEKIEKLENDETWLLEGENDPSRGVPTSEDEDEDENGTDDKKINLQIALIVFLSILGIIGIIFLSTGF